MMIPRSALALGALFAPLLTDPRLRAQEPAFDLKANYVKRDYMVPMRDGVKLFTIVYTPRDTSRDQPILLFRTPYSIRPYEPDVYRHVLGPSREFDRDGYMFVFQDVRGKFRSEGEFEVMRPFKPVKRDVQGRRRKQRHVRHDRLAAQEHSEEQRARRDVGHLVSRMADGDGDDGSAPRAQGGVSAGVAVRHVHRRRLPP